MISFFLSHIRSHFFRSISMFFIACICIVSLSILLFFYQNIVGALTHYNYSTVDERRFTLRSDTNFFTLFSRNSVGLPSGIVDELQSSSRFDRIQSFSLVELPVLAKFSLFSFGLETDIPVFSVTDSALTGATLPIGISRSMVDFYNIQFAGTSIMFPKVTESFLLGQSVRITFGASKIFPSLSHIATPIDGSIVRIGDDFPGFWIVLPESIVKQKMKEIGYPLAAPYKIVAYMKNPQDRAEVEKKYSSYHPEFDIDSIKKTQEKIYFLRSIFFGISFFIASILGIFFVFLLFSFFRERRDVFRIVYIFWLSWIRAKILTLAEPIFLLFFWSIAGSILSYFFNSFLVSRGTIELLNRGISYVLVPVGLSGIIYICLIISIIFTLLIVALEYSWRKKSLMR